MDTKIFAEKQYTVKLRQVSSSEKVSARMRDSLISG
jgi:hypothetical protein